jgi:hypothetical protein
MLCLYTLSHQAHTIIATMLGQQTLNDHDNGLAEQRWGYVNYKSRDATKTTNDGRSLCLYCIDIPSSAYCN